MTADFPDATQGRTPVTGPHERRLATNYLANQASQAVGAATGLGVITVLGRTLPLDEFGTFALLLSLTSYLVVIQAVVELPAIKAFAEATDQRARESAFSTVVVVYSGTGLVAGGLVLGL